jgi:vacuole morphology and inheritance protein 14
VFVCCVQVLARISLDPIQFQRVLNALVQLFLEDRPLLETRGGMVIRKLCALLDPQSIYISLSAILGDKNELEFVGLMVQTLNLILLTAPELNPLRRSLKNSFQQSGGKESNAVSAADLDRLTPTGAHTQMDDRQVFVSLFRCWCHNPVATFSLCLLAQVYDLSSHLILKFAEVDVTVGFLMQIDKLVQLLESPIFIRLRLQLLEVNTKNHADLLRSLYGLLMLLPQSQAYKTLSDRLSTVSSLHMHIGFTQSHTGQQQQAKTQVAKVANGQSESNSFMETYADLLSRFEFVQEKHTQFRHATLREKSLIPPTGSYTQIAGTTQGGAATQGNSTPAAFTTGFAGSQSPLPEGF